MAIRNDIEAAGAHLELAREGSRDKYEEAVRALVAANTAAFTEMTRLRHATALATVEQVVEHVRTLLEESKSKVVVFAHYYHIIDAIRDGLAEFAPVVCTGDLDLNHRQATVDRFEIDPTCHAFVGSIPAARGHITLSASSHVVFAELERIPDC